MRQTIEQRLRAMEGARRTLHALDRASESAAWARAEQAHQEAIGRVAHEVQEAVRRLGLVRDLSRALAGTGFAVSRTAFDPLDSRLAIELDGGPDTPAQRRAAAAPALGDRLHRLADDFFSQTGIELAFPYERLTE